MLKLRDDNGSWLEESTKINSIFLAYYRKLFSFVGPRPMDEALQYVRKVITDANNQSLMMAMSEVEIEEAVFQLNATNAPGPNGFTGLFYQSSWSTVKPRIFKLVF